MNMKTMNVTEMQLVNAGAGCCRYCGQWCWTAFGAGLHGLSKHGSKAWKAMFTGKF